MVLEIGDGCTTFTLLNCTCEKGEFYGKQTFVNSEEPSAGSGPDARDPKSSRVRSLPQRAGQGWLLLSSGSEFNPHPTFLEWFQEGEKKKKDKNCLEFCKVQDKCKECCA